MTSLSPPSLTSVVSSIDKAMIAQALSLDESTLSEDIMKEVYALVAQIQEKAPVAIQQAKDNPILVAKVQGNKLPLEGKLTELPKQEIDKLQVLAKALFLSE
jgi:hypothetical protein